MLQNRKDKLIEPKQHLQVSFPSLRVEIASGRRVWPHRGLLGPTADRIHHRNSGKERKTNTVNSLHNKLSRQENYKKVILNSLKQACQKCHRTPSSRNDPKNMVLRGSFCYGKQNFHARLLFSFKIPLHSVPQTSERPL